MHASPRAPAAAVRRGVAIGARDVTARALAVSAGRRQFIRMRIVL